tara:strand:+ start:858 stop:1130 length:273 start_codon:yes stop_codon:yes gene_type:complete
MQKIVNVISIFSGIVSLSIVGVTGYVFLNRESIVEGVKTEVIKSATEAVSGALPGIVKSAVPGLPSSTGGVQGLPSSTGGVSGLGGFAPF